MNSLLATSLSVGVLAGVFVYLLSLVSLPAWVGFIAWATFFAAGGKIKGLYKGILANWSGLVWAYLALWAWLSFASGNVLALAGFVALIAFLMVAQSKISLLSFVPGAFAGAASFFGATGAGLLWYHVALALLGGAIFGYLSELGGQLLTKKEEAPSP